MRDGYGYHYGPCKTGGGGLLLLILVGVVLLASGGISGAESDITTLAILLAGTGLAVAVATVAIVIGITRHENKGRGTLSSTTYRREDGRIVMRIRPDYIAYVRAWNSLPASEQCAPQWDFLTGLDDGNREEARRELEARNTSNPW